MATRLTVKEGASERSWEIVDGQQIDIHMAKGAEYHLTDTETGQPPQGLRIAQSNGQIEVFGSDSYPWVTLYQDGAAEAAGAEKGTAGQDAVVQGVERTFEPAPPAAEESSILAAKTPDITPADSDTLAADMPVAHLRAGEVADVPVSSQEDFASPSIGSLLIAAGGALAAGGIAAAASGGGGSNHGGLTHDRDLPQEPSYVGDAPYTLRLNNEQLDLGKALQGSKLDLDNGRNDLLQLNANDLFGKAGELDIDGNFGDKVQLSGGHWTQLADEGKYHVYQHNNLIARIEDDISVAMI